MYIGTIEIKFKRLTGDWGNVIMLKCVVSARAGLGAGGVKGTDIDKGCFFIRFCSRSACCRWAVAAFFFSRLSNFSAAST